MVNPNAISQSADMIGDGLRVVDRGSPMVGLWDVARCGQDTCTDAGDIIRYLEHLEQRQVPARWSSKYSSP